MSEHVCIEFHNVGKSFQSIRALDGISFSVKRGEILGFIGPNGAGKTTSMKILVGLIREFTGDVLINGQSLRQATNVSQKIGYMPQETGFQEWRTVESALTTFGLLSGIQRSQLKDRIITILNLVGLPDLEQRDIIHLSGGMQQKLKLAQALIHDPDIIILDEPMNGLDPTSRYQMKGLIKQLAGQGKTIVFSSHILSDIQDIANSIAIINQGHILKIDSPEALQNEFQIGTDLELTIEANSPICRQLDSIKGIEKVSQPSANKQFVHIAANVNLESILYSIMKLIMDQQIKIRNFNILRPSLEYVYMRYVGGATGGASA